MASRGRHPSDNPSGSERRSDVKSKKIFPKLMRKENSNERQSSSTHNKSDSFSHHARKSFGKFGKLKRKSRKIYPVADLHARLENDTETGTTNSSSLLVSAKDPSDVFPVYVRKIFSSSGNVESFAEENRMPRNDGSSDSEVSVGDDDSDADSSFYSVADDNANCSTYQHASILAVAKEEQEGMSSLAESANENPCSSSSLNKEDTFKLPSTSKTECAHSSGEFASEDKQEPLGDEPAGESYVCVNTNKLFEKPSFSVEQIPPYRPVLDNGDCASSTKQVADLQDGTTQTQKETPNEKENSDSKCSSSFQYSDPYFPSLLLDSVRELALQEEFTDVIIEADGQRIPCHRIILAASSEYFRAMFCNGYRERSQDNVKIQSVSADVMKVLIRFAYTSSLQVSSDNVQTVLEAASLLQFTRVMEACSNFFIGELAIENAPGIMELAQRHNLKHLLLVARLKCVTCFEELREKSDFLTLSAGLLESLIKRNDLMVKQEEEIFRVVMDWCQDSQEKRIKHLPQLLQHVKMPLIDSVYFVREVETHPLIRNNPDVFDLLMETRLYHATGAVPKDLRGIPRQTTCMNQVFITVGGCDKDDHFVYDVVMFDFQHKTRSTLCQLPSFKNSTRVASKDANGAEARTRWAEFACASWKGNIVISGGKETKKEVWMFITSLRQWVALGDLNTARWRHRMVTCKGKLYAVGGYDGLLRVESLEEYCERSNRWHEKRAMREAVSSAAICECEEQIYVIGGGPSVRISTERVQVYDPDKDSWSLSTPLPEPAKCINAVSLRSMIYVAGGTLRNFLTFDSSSKIWSPVGEPMPSERASCGLTVCSNMIFIVGGRDEQGRAIQNVSYFDPKTTAIQSECNMSTGISHHGCLSLEKYDHLRARPV